MINIDSWLDRRYDLRSYNCGHFVADVWRELTGEEIRNICQNVLNGDIRSFQEATRKYTRLPIPLSPCVVIMRGKNLQTHAGVFVDEAVLHLTNDGVRYQTLYEFDKQYRMSYYR